MGFNQTGPAFLDAYRSPLGSQRASFSIAVPLMQWGAGDADIEAGRASLARVETLARARREDLADQGRFAALGFTQSQSALSLFALTDTVAGRRFTVAKAQYDRGTLSLTEFFLAQSEKDAARESYAQSLRGYWTAFYQLRRATLYDFVAGRAIE